MKLTMMILFLSIIFSFNPVYSYHFTPPARNSLESIESIQMSIASSEQEGDWMKAARQSERAVYSIYEDLKVNQLIASIRSKLTIKKEEVIASRHTKTTTSSSSGRGRSGARSSTSTWNVTKILTTNPEEIAAFQLKKKTDFASLKKTLQRYIKENSQAIVLMKVLTVKTYEYLFLAMRDGVPDLAPESHLIEITNRLAEMTKNFSFFGLQTISVCTRVEYAGRVDSSSSSGQFSRKKRTSLLNAFLTFLQPKITRSYSDSYSVEYFPYSETKCEPTRKRQAKVSADETFLEVDLSYLDSLQKEWADVFHKTLLLNDLDEPNSQTWGNSYLTPKGGW